MAVANSEMIGRDRLHRWSGLVAVATRRVFAPGASGTRGRLALSVTGVAVAVALLLVVTGLATGLALAGAVYSDDVTYVLLPPATAGEAAIANPDNPQFGDAHAGMAALLDNESVTSATPVLVHLVSMETPDNRVSYLLLIGVVPEHAPATVGGLPTASFADGTPYHGAGEWTGETIVSPAAAEVFGLEADEEFVLHNETESFTVMQVANPAAGSPLSGTPVAIVHLGELQRATGFDGADQAHQFLIEADDEGAAVHLKLIYPDATVRTQTGMLQAAAVESGLPLALAGTALVVAVAIGVLFVATAMGIEVASDRRQQGTLAAIGFADRSRIALVSVQTMVVVMLGSMVGTLIGLLGLRIVNTVVADLASLAAVAVTPRWLIPYGIGVGLCIGLLSLPYVAMLTSGVRPVEGR